jgi:anti-sigma-K factor RskA
MMCRQVQDLVDELVDGALDAERERALRGHLRGCASCSALVAQTEKLVAAAASFGTIDPPASLWEGIAARLDADDRQAEQHSGWWWRWKAWRGAWVTVGGVALAGAAVALLALGPMRRELPGPVDVELRAVRFADAASRLAHAETDYAQALGELAVIVEEDKAHWDEAARAGFEENRRAIDAILEQKRQLARLSPDDLELQDALFLAYRRKLELYQDAALKEGL